MGSLRFGLAPLLYIIPVIVSAQIPQPIPIQTAQAYFAEAAILCEVDLGQLWGVSRCSPIR